MFLIEDAPYLSVSLFYLGDGFDLLLTRIFCVEYSERYVTYL